MGALDPAHPARASHAVADLLRHSGTVEVVDDIRSAKWMKLVVNAAELIPSAIIDTELNDRRPRPGHAGGDARRGVRGDAGRPGRWRHDHADHRHAPHDDATTPSAMSMRSSSEVLTHLSRARIR
jgi:hypothetical protein